MELSDLDFILKISFEIFIESSGGTTRLKSASKYFSGIEIDMLMYKILLEIIQRMQHW